MKNELTVAYNEIDFLLPVHRFNIRFSYVTKKGLPFIREFLLRLIHLAPMKPSQIAGYFGFSQRETSEALSDLVESGDLVFQNDGSVSLTNQSLGYFTGLGTTPQVSAVLEHGGNFNFELASFKCTGIKRTQDKWVNGLRLEASHENVANSERMATKNFQDQFYTLLDKKYLPNLRNDESVGKPSIYKMESIKKLGQEPLRINQIFSMDPNGSPLERNDIETCEDTPAIQGLITSTLHAMRKQNNVKEIITAIETIGDQYTGALLSESGIDVAQLIINKATMQSINEKTTPFIGPIYSNANWLTLEGQLNPILNKMEKEHLDGVEEFIWLAPSDGFWGKSTDLSNCFGKLISQAMTAGKNPKPLYKPKVYAPLAGSADKISKRRWMSDLANNIQHVDGFIEGFLNGHVEVLLLPERFVVVCYHVSCPEKFPVTIPVGFMSTDIETVWGVNKMLRDYIDGFESFEKPRYLGAISKL